MKILNILNGKINRARQTRLVPILKPGDHVAVKVEGHHCGLIFMSSLSLNIPHITHIRHLVSGKERVLHRGKLIQLPKADPTPELRTAYSEEDDYIDEDDSDGRVARHVRVQGGESPPIAQTLITELALCCRIGIGHPTPRGRPITGQSECNTPFITA